MTKLSGSDPDCVTRLSLVSTRTSGGLSRTGCCTSKIVHSHGWWLMNQCWLLAAGLGSSHRPLHGAVSDKATGFARDGGSEE